MSDFIHEDRVRTDPEVRKELAREAKELLRPDGAFVQAVLALRRQWFGNLMTEIPDNAKQLELIAKLKALEAIPAMLESLVNDQKAAENRVSRVGRI